MLFFRLKIDLELNWKAKMKIDCSFRWWNDMTGFECTNCNANALVHDWMPLTINQLEICTIEHEHQLCTSALCCVSRFTEHRHQQQQQQLHSFKTHLMCQDIVKGYRYGTCLFSYSIWKFSNSKKKNMASNFKILILMWVK